PFLDLLSSCSNVTTLGISLTVFALVFDFMKRRKRWNYPPGPGTLPFIGNLLQVDVTNPSKTSQKLAKKFGKAFSVQVGWIDIVVLSGYEIIKEALCQKPEDFSDRPILPLTRELGILFAKYSLSWKEQRRFCLSTLRNFGLGKKSLEQRVTEEAGFLCSEFSAKQGHPFNPHILIKNAVSNVICTMTFGDRYEYKDETFLELMHLLEDLMKSLSSFLTQVVALVPVLSHIPGPHRKAWQLHHEFLDFIRKTVKEHKESRDPAFARDLIDSFLEEMEKNKGNPETSFNETNLLHIALDMFAAGTETSSTTLRWGLIYMVLYPDIQKKAQKEIDNVIGRDRPPTMEDQVNLPYTNAVIHEIQRYGDILPGALPHMAYQDTEIQGYFIPKGTIVIINLSSLLKDEAVWKKQHQFYPENFLDSDGQFVRQEAFLPFSTGRRVCLGEQLAKMELFIFFTSFLQHFTFCIPPNQPRPRENGYFSIIMSPHPYQICAIPR
uniref:Cytochrome P450 family 2 subfamily D member 113 n=1 Tax=Sphenodon punctatus TaxID=8508 RepID=A0A8D0GJD0_SPHPU